MNELELFPEAAIWDINKLIDDINAARNRLDNKGAISQMHRYYLAGILAGQKPIDICLILNSNLNLDLDVKVKSIRTALSTEINPYVKELLGYPDDLKPTMYWPRACVLLEEAGYKNPSSLPDERDNSVSKIKLDLDNTSLAFLHNILTEMQKMAQDPSIKILSIYKGCIELVLSGSSEGLKRLASLIESGELTEINGVKIISVESTVEPSKVVRLSNWLDNLVESGWSALEQLLNPQQLQLETIRSDDLRKGKLIDRTMLDDGFAVILTLKQELLADDSVDITLRLYPTDQQAHLPSDIKLRMFASDEDGNEVSIDTSASSSDEWIQLHFTGKPGEEFAVEIVKGDISVIENFVI